MRTPRDPGIWFPAKRYGWGWGIPVTWQGWAVLIGWVVLLLAGVSWTLPEHPTLHLIFVVAMIAALMAVCYAKGERPRWRWGDDRK